jgi:hypothetical protein
VSASPAGVVAATAPVRHQLVSVVAMLVDGVVAMCCSVPKRRSSVLQFARDP